MMFTLSEENYLKTIYHLGLNSEIGVSTNEIAKKMKVTIVAYCGGQSTCFSGRLVT